MRRLLVVACLLLSFVLAAPAQEKPGADKLDDGWIDLMKPEAWKKMDEKWIFTDAVKLAPDEKERPDVRLKVKSIPNGTIWVNGETGRLPNLVTKETFGDCEVHVEFLISKGSNSGIKFHEVYEIQITDSYGKKEVTGSDMGGIYPRADSKSKHLDKGTAPKVNAARPFGEWQTLDVTWQSPRFNAKGEKTTHAKIVKAILNGELIHENLEVKTPTGSNWEKKETPTGSFLLQCDHGPIAWRKVSIKPLKQ